MIMLIIFDEKKMVRTRGFEPPRREAQAPQACVSTVPPRAHIVVI